MTPPYATCTVRNALIRTEARASMISRDDESTVQSKVRM
jgi:hypothetical protein